jgi:NAD(P)-dependent dehydrogenase (short-subunit alcohol dehydrogenase family)
LSTGFSVTRSFDGFTPRRQDRQERLAAWRAWREILLSFDMKFMCLAVLLALTSTTLSAQAIPSTVASSGEVRSGQQVILITGSTDGLGREVAVEMAKKGAHIIVHGRNLERGREVVEEIARAGASARFYAADLASLDQVRGLANAIIRDYPRLDVLVNNAGIGSADDKRELSADGHELRFAVNYLSGFLLTRMLLPRLIESAPSRIVNVASGAQMPIDFNDVMLRNGYSGSRAYAQSKLAQILFTFDLARELEGKGVIVDALHPATLMNTSMVEAMGRRPMSTVEEGAAAVIQLITAPGLRSGQYYNGLQPARPNAQAYDEAARARLRILSMQLTGLDGP